MINILLVSITCFSLVHAPIVATCIALFMGLLATLICISGSRTELDFAFVHGTLWYFAGVGFVTLLTFLPIALEQFK